MFIPLGVPRKDVVIPLGVSKRGWWACQERMVIPLGVPKEGYAFPWAWQSCLGLASARLGVFGVGTLSSLIAFGSG